MTTAVQRVRNARGFTLIELMIVLVILAIVTSIAAGVFSGAGEDGARSQAVAELSSLNDAMARYYQGNYSYEGATLADLRSGSGGPVIEESPEFEVALTIDADNQGYTLISKPRSTSGVTGYFSVNDMGQRCSAADCSTHW